MCLSQLHSTSNWINLSHTLKGLFKSSQTNGFACFDLAKRGKTCLIGRTRRKTSFATEDSLAPNSQPGWVLSSLRGNWRGEALSFLSSHHTTSRSFVRISYIPVKSGFSFLVAILTFSQRGPAPVFTKKSPQLAKSQITAPTLQPTAILCFG